MPRCNKRRYRDQVAAQLALAVISRVDRPTRHKTEKRAYRCGMCRGWHLTSRRR